MHFSLGVAVDSTIWNLVTITRLFHFVKALGEKYSKPEYISEKDLPSPVKKKKRKKIRKKSAAPPSLI